MIPLPAGRTGNSNRRGRAAHAHPPTAACDTGSRSVNGSSAAGVVTSAAGCPSGPLTSTSRLTGSIPLNPGVFSSLASQLSVNLPFRVGAVSAALLGSESRLP